MPGQWPGTASVRAGSLPPSGPVMMLVEQSSRGGQQGDCVACYDPTFAVTVAYTLGFASARQLNRHYALHGAEFGVSNAAQYELLADQFLGRPKPSHVQECRRKRGDVLRFDPSTQEYGVLGGNQVIRTYFKPVPCVDVPAAMRASVAQAGRCHGHPDNLLYFQSECARW